MVKKTGTSIGSLVMPAITLLVLTLIALVIMNQAHAGTRVTRQSCQVRGSAGDRGRQMGERNSARIVEAMWSKLRRDCSQLERLTTIISDTPLGRPTQGGAAAACFYMGYTDGLWNKLDEIYDRCGQVCFGAGAEIGRISAEGYCAASIAVDGLLDPGFISQPPLPFCGETLVLGCKTEYISAATYEINGCYPYTVGHFEETFDNSVRQDCYVPTDIPIRDENLYRFLGLTGPIVGADLEWASL